MLTSFSRFFTSLDGFGKPVNINYRGRETFQTTLGALFTLGLQIFLLTYASIQVIDAFGYKDPKITQYTVFNERSDGAELNYGELFGSFSFGFVNQEKFGFPEPNPRIGHFVLDNRKFGQFKGLKADSRDKLLDMASISEERFP